MQTRRPNLIVFFTDQQRWDTIGAVGSPLGITPNLDAFGRDGTIFEYAFTCQPVCGPARSALQTGRYPTETGCFTNGVPLPSGTPTLATWFGQAGYDTGYIGKWHLGAEDPVPPDERGDYRYWRAANLLEFSSGPYDTVLYDEAGQSRRLPGYRVDAITDEAIRFVHAHRDRPFFLFISFLEPHHQNVPGNYPAPDVYRDLYQGRWIPPDLAALGGDVHQHAAGYYGMVKRLDEAFGRLRDALKSLDLSDDTMLVYTSDHGNHFRTRNDEYKRSPHESSIRIPLLAGGGPFRRGGRVRELVSLVDLAPTLLDAAEIPPTTPFSGRSAMPLVRRSAASWRDAVYVQVSESQVGRAVRTSRWKYAVAAPDADGWHQPYADHYVESLLYDLDADPYELTNLVTSPSHRAIREELRTVLLDAIQEAGEPRPRIEAAPTSK